MKKYKMIYLMNILISVVILSSCSYYAPEGEKEKEGSLTENEQIKITPPIISLIDVTEVENNLREITSSSRKRGTEENIKAGAFLYNKMRSYGYDVEFQEFDGYETSLVQMMNDFKDLNPNKGSPIFKGRNIICQRSDFDADRPTMVYSAHYDTTTDNIGALDNASGVCALMEVARILASAELPYNIKFVFFDSEEYYLQGSRFFVNSMSENDRNHIYANFNVDMVGNEKARDLVFVTNEEDELFKEAKRIFPKEQIKSSQWGQSDDMSFGRAGIKNIRYTSVDIFSEEFDPSIWTKETDAFWVDMNKLAEDIHIIGTYATEIEISG
ncbi:MAG: M28 family peptidase [Peptostreptococcaceae bacterium]|nr:M28 family peptidase [Peptostreptococcaceae bacterium]